MTFLIRGVALDSSYHPKPDIGELARDRSAMSLEAANRKVYLLLKEGIKVSVPNKERGGQKTVRVQVIDRSGGGERRCTANSNRVFLRSVA